MKKIIATALILIFSGVIPVSCICDCGCGDSEVKNFNITALGIKTTNLSNTEIDTSGFYFFDNIFKTFYIAEREFVSMGNVLKANYLFTSNASACSPKQPLALQDFSNIKITSLSNITLDDANDLITSGQDITNRFVMTFSIGDHFQPIETFIQNNHALTFSETVRIRLSKKPYQETKIVLRIVATMTDGRLFEFDNQVLKAK